MKVGLIRCKQLKISVREQPVLKLCRIRSWRLRISQTMLLSLGLILAVVVLEKMQ